MTGLETTVLAAAGSDGSGDWSLVGLVLFASGFVFYAVTYVRYRNTDKRYRHESRTRTVTTGMQARDEKVRSLTGLRSSRMRGANNRSVRGALNSGGVRKLASDLGLGGTGR